MAYNFQRKFIAFYLLFFLFLGRGWTLQLAGFLR